MCCSKIKIKLFGIILGSDSLYCIGNMEGWCGGKEQAGIEMWQEKGASPSLWF
jgi:hypothetical protein